MDLQKKKLDALREFLPKFSARSTILPIYEDGKYKYIDFSRGFFYETLIGPAQEIFTHIELNPDRAIMPLLAEGMGRATARIMEPFIGEAIWTGAWLDIFARGEKIEMEQESGTHERIQVTRLLRHCSI